jgi:hypothetical protein
MRQLGVTAFAGLCIATVVFACGSDESAAPPSSSTSSSSGGSSGGSSGTSSSGGSSGTSSSGGSSGDSGVDAGPKCGADGATCTGGSCTRDVCRPDVTISADSNLSTEPVTAGRTCAEAISYSVTALTATTATVATAPDVGCLTTGDEIMLINLQGSAATTANVGVYENLHVASVSGSVITFTSAKTKQFGEVGDTNIGTATANQKVMLVRVPNFGKLTIAAGKTVTAAAWDGLKGGVVTFRTNALTLDGTIDARTLGYRGGRWSRDNDDCDDNVQTEAGESIAGPGDATSAANGGGSGGIGALDNVSFNGNDPLTGSAGHASAGQAGTNFQGRTASAAGAAYGVGDGSKLTMGSGGGGNLTCEVGFAGPALIEDSRVSGGGIIAVFGGNITVSATGVIDAAPADGTERRPPAGYVLLRGDVIDFSAGKVQAKAVAGSAVTGTYTNVGSEGRIAILFKTSVAGTADPVASAQQITNP